MARSKKDPNEPRPLMITWNESMRFGLDVLKADFENSFDEKTRVAIFCELFKDELQAQGNPEVQPNKLTAQYGEKKKDLAGGRPRNWAFCVSNSPATTARRDTFKSKIESIKQSLGRTATSANSSRKIVAARTVRTAAGPSQRPSGHQPVTSDSSSRQRAPLDRSARSMFKKRTLGSDSVAESFDDLSVILETPTKRRKIVKEVDPQQLFTPPSTSKSPKKKRVIHSQRPDATEWHEQRPGVGFAMTPGRKATTMKDLVWPGDDVVHPNITGPLYRIWDEKSQGMLTPSGYVAGAFKVYYPNIPVPAPPSRQEPQWMNLTNHFGCEEIATPFISCSNNLLWVLRNAIIRAKDSGSPNARVTIAIIDASRMERGHVFHAKPLHDAIKPKAPWSDGKFRYHGKYEFLAYAAIPANAIVQTVRLADIHDLANRLPAVGATLRLDQIYVSRKGYHNTILPALKEQDLKLTPAVVKSFADIARFLGIGYNSPMFASAIVSDICAGWGIKIDAHTDDEWISKADTFAAAMCQGSPMSFEHISTMKWAFLNGVGWGSAADGNPKFKATTAVAAQKKMGRIGLKSIAQLTIQSLEAAKLAVWRLEKTQQRLLPQLPASGSGSRSRRALEYGVEEDNEVEEEDDEEDVRGGHDGNVVVREYDGQVWVRANTSNDGVEYDEEDEDDEVDEEDVPGRRWAGLSRNYDDDDGSVYDL